MDGHGQPALLYLVPCTLGNKFLYLALGRVIFLLAIERKSSPTVSVSFWLLPIYILNLFHPSSPSMLPGLIGILGLVRGELKHLWNYATEEPPSSPRGLSGEA